jgi:hypothetical protein
MIRMLFDRLGEARITEGLIRASVANFCSGGRLLKLLEEHGGPIHISSQVLEAAASNGSLQMMKELVNRPGCSSVTDGVLVAAPRIP